jgi:hypothetical protein
MGVYSELRGFVLAHRDCAGDLGTPRWTRPRRKGTGCSSRCGCGVEFKRWVAPKDADEDLLRSALLAFEN